MAGFFKNDSKGEQLIGASQVELDAAKEDLLSYKVETTTELALKTSKVYVDAEIASVADGTPESFADLTAIGVAYPTGDALVKLNLDDGYVYKWSGSAWVQGWIYQATELGDGTVTPAKASFIDTTIGKNRFNKNDADIVDGYTLVSDGTLWPAPTYFITHYVSAEYGNTIYFSNNGAVLTVQRCIFLDANKAQIGYSAEYISSAVIIEGTAFVLLSPPLAAKPTFQVEYTGRTAFVEYAETYSLNGVSLKTDSVETAMIKASSVTNDKLASNIDLVLPSVIPMVVGHEMNIYFENILKGKMLKTVDHITSDSTTPIVYEDSLRFNLSSVTDQTVTIHAYEHHLEESNVSKSFLLKAIPATAGSTLLEKTVIIIGDSKVEYGATEVQTLVDLFAVDSMPVSFIGSRGTATAKHEGRSGWSAKNYCRDATYGGLPNDFYNAGLGTTDKFDFTYYMTQKGYANVDYVFINLGSNDTASVSISSHQAIITNYYLPMINSVLAYNPTVKIIIGLTENTCQLQLVKKSIYGDGNKDKLLSFAELLITNFDNAIYNARVFVCPLYINLDLYNDYDFTETALSARNSTLVKRVVDMVHQSVSAGFPKMSDVMFATIKYLAHLEEGL